MEEMHLKYTWGKGEPTKVKTLHMTRLQVAEGQGKKVWYRMEKITAKRKGDSAHSWLIRKRIR